MRRVHTRSVTLTAALLALGRGAAPLKALAEIASTPATALDSTDEAHPTP